MLNTLGNIEILQSKKTAFLCSRKISAGAVLRCYDWAIEQREKGRCVISGFHSPIEKDVFHYLQKGKQSIVLALARGIPAKIDPQMNSLILDGRLLIISPFRKDVKRVSEQTALRRNTLMVELADDIVIGFESETGTISKLNKSHQKPIQYLYTKSHYVST